MTLEPADASQSRLDASRPSRLDASRPLRDRREKSHIGWYWWLLWWPLLAIGMFIFYVLFTPVWIGIRLAAWVSERSARRRPS